MEIELLKDIVVVFALSVAVLLIFHRIKAPTIVGFLLTGILAGPQGLGLIQASDQVSDLAEIGVVLLLFTVGIEVSLRDLMKLKKYVLVGGSLQVLLTILLVFFILSARGDASGEAMLLGFLISLSSTAIVLRIIQRREQFDSIYGRTTLGILIFQDLAIVPMMLVVPLLPGALQAETDHPLTVVVKALGLIVFVIISAKWIMPRLLYQIAKTQDRELFLLSIVAICFAVAWMSSQAGLSLGLGAFLAGLTISESPYNHQAFGNILPLRDAFTSFFFISIGMLLDVNYLMQNPGYIILIAIGVMLLKAVIAGFTISFMGLPLRMAVLVGLALSQIGEFSFILSKVGYDCGLVSQEIYQLFLDVAVLTMGATSFLMASSQKLADGLLLLPLPERLKNRSHALSTAPSKSWRDHLIIVGYGVNGRNVARSAKAKGIPFVIVEMDPEIVSYEGKIGEPIYYGDATQENVLQHVNVREARVMVIAISDPEATRRIVEVARRLNFDLFIIARTRYLDEMLPLHNLGANEVIPEEYETSVEIFSRVLKQYDVPRDQIESFIQEVRSDGYEMFRSLSPEPYCDANVDLITDEIGTFRVCSGSPICGRPVADIELERHATKMLAIHRDMKTIANPDESFILKVDDVAILMGPEESLSVLGNLFHSPMMK
ncbi:MAG: glutathione-regulated potassium-efflux system protein KefC [Methanosaeta sp. PtaU1.Bin016]|nr:MAG: glutathione-regulated potassium-efflux system protein KefC [Methanosaeta sp. PtaU1.Bin016]